MVSSLRLSAGILLYRISGPLEVLIAHPGGPYWRNKDDGVWSIPKGLLRSGEDAIAAAQREFREETGLVVETDGLIPLGSIRQTSGKTVVAWAAEGDAPLDALVSNMFSMEWPPGSGRFSEFPEMDRFLWAESDLARAKLNRAQRPFVSRLEHALYSE